MSSSSSHTGTFDFLAIRSVTQWLAQEHTEEDKLACYLIELAYDGFGCLIHLSKLWWKRITNLCFSYSAPVLTFTHWICSTQKCLRAITATCTEQEAASNDPIVSLCFRNSCLCYEWPSHYVTPKVLLGMERFQLACYWHPRTPVTPALPPHACHYVPPTLQDLPAPSVSSHYISTYYTHL